MDGDGFQGDRRPAVKPHSAPQDHNQFVEDPLAHFRAIPWCRKLLDDPMVLETIIVDRRPIPSGESSFVRRVMNTGTTVRACITFLRMAQPPRRRTANDQDMMVGAAPLSQSRELLRGGGDTDGENPRNPFLLVNALLDLGEDLCGYKGTLHGGLFTVLLDEVMGTAANYQAEHGAYTVRYNIDIRKAIKLPQIVMVRARVFRKEGRKIYVRGTIEDHQNDLMAEADGIWVQMGHNVGRSQL
ncbi:HotDog domain-containing protein [Echria macrotheca]|uniref:HotDog domain-containing protein n=1 Tax=Echria macrotheca TaxID=438768 RepID=A0AAJ0BK58_9PEZI|nr:HotDog domain-containing protein [Echria macrotheca]